MTTKTSPLPKYETPLMKRDFQNVRTTAYTHTEADHRQFTNHNALGGQLHAATGAIRRAEYTPRALPVSADEQSDYRRASYTRAALEPFSMEPRRTTKLVKTKHGQKRVVVVTKPQIGSAAADWSRWPAGTVFRLLSTGQVYKIDDYGWALAGRNTIDLYMPTRSAMNSWGARAEGIQVLRWGNSNESLRLLQAHQGYRHIRRMVLELEGQDAAAASLE
ncbi:MAG TPA: hypothetical protein VF345_14670 [Chthoniobacterales bacterium]